MTTRPVVLGLSCGILPADPTRALYKGKALHYGEAELSEAVAATGAVPLLLPALANPTHLATMLRLVDGLVLSGGTDVSPHSYGETPLDPAWAGDRHRDGYEQVLVAAALAAGLPVLGVCRGAQFLNVALGGSLLQDIGLQHAGALVHRDWDRYDDNGHPLTIFADSWLAAVYGPGTAHVNSVHHQTIHRLAPSLRVTAHAPDNIIEAVELIDEQRFAVGIQWHPEWFATPADSPPRLDGHVLFAAFTEVVATRRPRT